VLAGWDTVREMRRPETPANNDASRRQPSLATRHRRPTPHGRRPNRLNPVPTYLARTFEVLPVSLRAVSRSLELSLQSSLQLSLTVLVSYRTRGCIALSLGGSLPAALSCTLKQLDSREHSSFGRGPPVAGWTIALVVRVFHPLRK